MLDMAFYWTGVFVWLGVVVLLACALLYPLAAAVSWHALCALRAIRMTGRSAVHWHLLPKSIFVQWWDFLRSGVPDIMTSTNIAWRGVFKWSTSFPKADSAKNHPNYQK